MRSPTNQHPYFFEQINKLTNRSQSAHSKNGMIFQNRKSISAYQNHDSHPNKQEIGYSPYRKVMNLNDQYQILTDRPLNNLKIQQKNPKIKIVDRKLEKNFPSFSQLEKLLRNEENLIETMKDKHNSEKQKIERDFEDWAQSFNHLLSDFKASVFMTIDFEYKKFLDCFSEVKKDFVTYCSLKKKYWNTQKSQKLQSFRFPGKESINNQQLLGNLNKDLQFCQNYLKYQNFSEIQQNLLRPVLQKSKQIYSHIQVQQIYESKKFHQIISKFYEKIKKQFHVLYPSIENFVNIFQYEEKIDASRSLSRPKSTSNLSTLSSPQFNFKRSKINKDNFLHTAEFTQPKVQLFSNTNSRIQEQKNMLSLQSQNCKVKFDCDTYSSTLGSRQNQRKQGWFSRSQQHINLGHKNKNNNVNEQNQETALVIQYLQEWNKIAVGTKNGYLKLYCAKTLQQIYKQKIFSASILSIASINQKYIALGSDFDPSSVALFDIFTKSVHKFNNHSAAITSIIDLKDGENFMSAGFDSIINVYNYKHKKLSFRHKCDDKILAIVFNSELNVIVSSHLKSKLCVWKILPKTSTQSFSGLSLVRSIILQDLPTAISLDPGNRLNIIVSTKNNKLMFIELETGKQIQRKNLESAVCSTIFICNKNNKGFLVCLKNGMIKYSSINGNEDDLTLGHGCNINSVPGVGPKAILTRQGCVFACNHNQKYQTQINSWQIFK